MLASLVVRGGPAVDLTGTSTTAVPVGELHLEPVVAVPSLPWWKLNVSVSVDAGRRLARLQLDVGHAGDAGHEQRHEDESDEEGRGGGA